MILLGLVTVTSAFMFGQLTELTLLIHTLSPYPSPFKGMLVVLESGSLEGIDNVALDGPWLVGEKRIPKEHAWEGPSVLREQVSLTMMKGKLSC